VNTRWNRLIEYLSANGWKQTPGLWWLEKGGWIYTWFQPGTTGTPEAMLVRRKQGKAMDPEDLELFLIRNEKRCLEIAANLNHDQHLPPLSPDLKTGNRVSYL
jgi:hypothetical protein